MSDNLSNLLNTGVNTNNQNQPNQSDTTSFQQYKVQPQPPISVYQPNVQMSHEDLKNAVKLTDEVILQEELQGIKNQKENVQNDYIDSLKKGLDSEDEYMKKVEVGDLSFIGAKSATIAEPSEDINEEDVLESTINIGNSYPETDRSSWAKMDAIDFDEFTPEYDTSEPEPEEESGVIEKTYSKLPICHMPDNPVSDSQAFMVKKESSKFDIVKKEKDTVLSDKSFLTSLNKVKKSLFSTITIPLLNSGFFAEVQGGGIMDMLQLYRDKLADTSNMEYDLERMKTFVRSIRTTTPSIPSESIISSIHESDYQLLALAYASATVKTLTQPNTCEHCNADFKIEMRPMDTILNIDEINERTQKLRNSNGLQGSLLSDVHEVSTEYGLKVTLGHPTFLDYLKRMESLRVVIENDKTEGYKFASNIKIVSMIRQIELPNGVKTSNAYQIYKAMSLFDESLYELIDAKILEMQKDLIIPQFGIKKVDCPVCGKTVENINIGAIDDLIFFHIMVTQF